MKEIDRATHKLAIALILRIATVASTQTSVLSQNSKIKLSQATQSQPTKFKVRIENISKKDGQTASNGTKWTLDFSPGVWLVYNNSNPLFTEGKKDRDQGLEAIAEDGNPMMLAKMLQNQKGILLSRVFNTAVGATKPSLSEIFDGDAPMTPRGCIAQAWTVAEVLRAWLATEQL